MRVQVKSWEKLVCEFGTRPTGTVDCPYGFHPAMRGFCGKAGTLIWLQSDGLCSVQFDGEKEPNDDATWHISMFDEMEGRPKLRLC